MKFNELLELKNDYKKYNDDNFYSFREFCKLFDEWEQDDRDLFYKLLDVCGIDFTRAINIVDDNINYIIYDNLEDYIYTSLEEQGQELPNWLCISAYDTYFYSLRYDDNLYFLDDMPQFAKDAEAYGDSRQKWLDGVRYLIDNSQVILLTDY